MRRFYAWLAALVVAAGLGLVVPGEASAAPYCGIAWGSLAKSNPALTQAQVVNVRTGQQPCFDRLVIDLNGAVAGYSIRYVPQVLDDGSGLPVELRGNAFLQVTVNAPAYSSSGNATYNHSPRPGSAGVRLDGRPGPAWTLVTFESLAASVSST